MTIVYGIKNCDTVKKALKWLNENNIDFQFHDFKTQGLSSELLTEFSTLLSWDLLVNKRSTTFRQLSDSDKENFEGELRFNAIIAQPTLLKRPVVKTKDGLHVGFKPAQYQEIFL